MIIVVMATSVAIVVSGCAGVFGLSDYSFDETTLGDGGNEASALDGSQVHSDAEAPDSGDAGEPAPTCTDGKANGKETDVDCGGPDCPKCGAKKQCSLPTDCMSPLSCVDELCLSPNSNDGVQDGTETDVDCGGTAASPCADNLMCLVGTDCKSKVCDPTKKTCTPASSTDGIQNGTETDVDCGGTGNPTCGTNKKCVNGTDCTSRVCTNEVCKAPTSTDGYKNGTETDVDCGGSGNPTCPVGDACLVPADCASIVCTGLKCIASSPADGVQNGSETDIDCGGGAAPACADGKMCKVGTDCADKVCNAMNRCAVPTSTDGVKNGTETGIDCGGGAPTNAPRCADNKSCSVGGDCVDKICTGGSCAVPTSTDGQQNGNETDIDCGGGPYNGGAAAPACAGTKLCKVATDCMSSICNMLVCTTASATDGVQNGAETDIDCGGGPTGFTNAPLCADTKGCGNGTRDCLSASCSATFKCSNVIGTDGMKDGNETDVDCGGPDPTTSRCATNQACVLPTDCANGACTANVCN